MVKHESTSIPIMYGYGGRLEDLIGKATFATELNPLAALAYSSLQEAPDTFVLVPEVVTQEDGTKKLAGLVLVQNGKPHA